MAAATSTTTAATPAPPPPALPMFAMPSPSPQHWSYQIPKSHIYPTSLDAINQRVAALRSVALGIPSVTRVSCSPLFLRVDVDENLTVERVGPRDSYITCASPLPEPDAAAVVTAAAHILARLHACGVVHGHVCRRVLLRHVADAHRCVLVESELLISALVPHGKLGTEARCCAAPEILRGEPYGCAADVWGLGVLFLQLVSSPTKSGTTDDLANSDLLSPFLSSLSPQASSFVLPCLKSDPQSRPLMDALLRHPFLATVSQAGSTHADAAENIERGEESGDATTTSAESTDTSDNDSSDADEG